MSICSLRGVNLQLCKRAFILVNKRPLPPVLYHMDTVVKRLAHNKTFTMKERQPSNFSYNAHVLKAVNCSATQKKLQPDCIKTDPCGPGGAGGKGGTGGAGDKCADDGGKDDSKKKIAIILAGIAAILGAAGAYAFYYMSQDHCPKDDVPEVKIPSKPKSSKDLPKHVPYLLVGGGTAAFSAFRAIKSNDARAKVLIITDESRKPYMRPPLSKELWYSAKDTAITTDYKFKQWTGTERSLFFEPEEFFIEPMELMESEKGGIAVAHGFTVKKVDPEKQIVTLSDGYEIGYNECLIATGCKPKSLSVFSNIAPSIQDKVMAYRTPDDFERLKNYIDNKKNVAIVGNGFTGSELACSLANYSKGNGSRIYQIFPEKGNMSKVLPDYLSKWTMKKMESQGVCILPQASVKNVVRDGCSLKLTLSTGETLISDVVVVCVGCEANTDIASPSGLEVDRNLGGFVVNAELEARRNLFVAGDASCFYDPLLGRRRVEHHDHSVISGRLAGENMVGKKKPYTHQSMFWSDLGPEIGYEGIGLVDSSLPTVGVFALPSTDVQRSDNLAEDESSEPEISVKTTSDSSTVSLECAESPNYGRGVIFYLENEKIVGILLWNIFNRVGLARTIINQNKKYNDLNEVAKLFEIHS